MTHHQQLGINFDVCACTAHLGYKGASGHILASSPKKARICPEAHLPPRRAVHAHTSPAMLVGKAFGTDACYLRKTCTDLIEDQVMHPVLRLGPGSLLV